MPAAIRVYEGKNKEGLTIQVAVDKAGKYFFRKYDFNGHGMQWSKWIDYTPTWCYKITDKHTGEIINLENPAIQYGNSLLKELSPAPRTKLPKTVI